MSSAYLSPTDSDPELAQLATLRDTTPGNGIALATHPDSNLITIFGQGLWTPATIAAHFRQMERAMNDMRARYAATRILCDIRFQLVQPQEIVESIRDGIERLYTPADRLATVVGSSLVKMQLRRQLARANAQYFISVDAAKTWLDAHN